jgi:hypothetical protein
MPEEYRMNASAVKQNTPSTKYIGPLFIAASLPILFFRAAMGRCDLGFSVPLFKHFDRPVYDSPTWPYLEDFGFFPVQMNPNLLLLLTRYGDRDNRIAQPIRVLPIAA